MKCKFHRPTSITHLEDVYYKNLFIFFFYFLDFLLFIIILKKNHNSIKNKPKMKCMNVMQMQTLMKYSFGHNRLKELTQGPCQTDSLRLSLLHPDKLGVGVSIRISPNLSSNIGINVKNLYQFMDKCHRILRFWHRHFLFECLL